MNLSYFVLFFTSLHFIGCSTLYDPRCEYGKNSEYLGSYSFPHDGSEKTKKIFLEAHKEISAFKDVTSYSLDELKKVTFAPEFEKMSIKMVGLDLNGCRTPLRDVAVYSGVNRSIFSLFEKYTEIKKEIKERIKTLERIKEEEEQEKAERLAVAKAKEEAKKEEELRRAKQLKQARALGYSSINYDSATEAVGHIISMFKSVEDYKGTVFDLNKKDFDIKALQILDNNRAIYTWESSSWINDDSESLPLVLIGSRKTIIEGSYLTNACHYLSFEKLITYNTAAGSTKQALVVSAVYLDDSPSS